MCSLFFLFFLPNVLRKSLNNEVTVNETYSVCPNTAVHVDRSTHSADGLERQ